MIDELEEMLKTAVGGVCQTMLNFDPRPIPLQKNAITSDAHLASSVGFIGKVTGVHHRLGSRYSGMPQL